MSLPHHGVSRLRLKQNFSSYRRLQGRRSRARRCVTCFSTRRLPPGPVRSKLHALPLFQITGLKLDCEWVCVPCSGRQILVAMARSKGQSASQRPTHATRVGRIKKKRIVRQGRNESSRLLGEAAALDSVATSSSIREMSHDELMALPAKQYSGTVVLVATHADLALAADDLLRQTVIGFDTETQPVFRKGQGQKPPSLVQLASGNAVYLFQLREKIVWPLLAELLAASHIVKAGVAVAGDIVGLKRVFAFDECSMMDIGLAARSQGMKQTGLRNLAAIQLGFRVCKGCRTSNWGAFTLSQQQITYAATDAWVGRELYLDFQRRGYI